MLLNLINCKTFTILHNPHYCYVYIPGTTCLHIPLAHPCLYYYSLRPQYTVLHMLLVIFIYFFYLYLYILSCVVLRILHCPLSGPDLIYISLRIIFCIIEFVVNKEPWTLNLARLSNKAPSLNPPLMQYCHVIVGKMNSNQGNILFITTANWVIPII